MELKTERLVLRRWRESDVDSLFKYASDPDIGPKAGWPPHTDKDMSLDVIQNVFCGAECYAICEKGSDEAIGAIELILHGKSNKTNNDDECELGYWIGKPFWGRGYMPEAAKELIRHGFEDLGMNIIWCGYYDGNTKSLRVQEKLGFEWHHTNKNMEVPLLNEVRIEHVSYMTREMWNRNSTNEKIVVMTYGHEMWDRTIKFAENCSWRAGAFLAEKMRENQFDENERVIIALIDDDIAGYCTFSNYDEIPPEHGLTPFVGFMFVDEKYRGHRLSGKLIDAACEEAKSQGYSKMYILSGEIGLYEKYGFVKQGDLKTIYDTEDQLFMKEI